MLIRLPKLIGFTVQRQTILLVKGGTPWAPKGNDNKDDKSNYTWWPWHMWCLKTKTLHLHEQLCDPGSHDKNINLHVQPSGPCSHGT